MSVWLYVGSKLLVAAVVLLLVWKGTEARQWLGGGQ